MNWITEAREAHQGAKATDAAAVLRELVEADAAYTNRGRVELRETYGAIVDRYFKAWEAARAFASGVAPTAAPGVGPCAQCPTLVIPAGFSCAQCGRTSGVAPTAQPDYWQVRNQTPVPDDVWEALQRMIENAASLGPACQEDALLIARWRGQFVAARERASGVTGTPAPQQAVQCAFCERSMLAGSECLKADQAATCEARAHGVAPSDKVQMPEKARAGIEVLHRVVESLLTTSRYVDEEGEATQALADLSDCIADPPFRALGVGGTLATAERTRCPDCDGTGIDERTQALDDCTTCGGIGTLGVTVDRHQTFCTKTPTGESKPE